MAPTKELFVILEIFFSPKIGFRQLRRFDIVKKVTALLKTRNFACFDCSGVEEPRLIDMRTRVCRVPSLRDAMRQRKDVCAHATVAGIASTTTTISPPPNIPQVSLDAMLTHVRLRSSAEQLQRCRSDSLARYHEEDFSAAR